MYLFSFDKFAWSDKVLKLSDGDQFSKGIKPGDLVKCGTDVFVVLGDEVSWPELYRYPYVPAQKFEVIKKWLLSKKTLALLHWMTFTYYSPYRSVMRYFISFERENLLERENKKKTDFLSPAQIEQITKAIGNIPSSGQTLIVFPDLWTMFNTLPADLLESAAITFLNSSATQNQKDKYRRQIKKWIAQVIVCTHAEIFQDFADLKKIILIDPHKWYYANQQDPRYKTGAVLEKMKEIYWAELEIVGVMGV